MKARERVAVAGIGMRSGSWIVGLSRDHADRMEIVGLCDPIASRAEAARARHHLNAALFTDYDAMLAAVRPDAVVLTGPEWARRHQIVRALECGCRVASEKPLCINGPDARAILEAEEKSGKKIFMAFNYRHVPVVSRVKELIRKGAIGMPLSADMSWYLDCRGHAASYFRRWHRRMDRSGGLLITKATHHFDMMNWFFDDRPVHVFAHCARNLFGPGKSPFKGERCGTCPHAAQCVYYTETDPEKLSAMLGYKVEGPAYGGDLCVFADEIDIPDTCGVQVRYRRGALLTYSLNCAVPFEGWSLAINGTKGRLETGIFDSKPEGGWQKRVKIMKAGQPVRDPALYVAEWPDAYRIVVIRHDGSSEDIAVNQGEGGHGGADPVLFRAFAEGVPDDRRDFFAGALDGAFSMGIGAAANVSSAEGRAVGMDEILGRWSAGA